MHRGVAQNELGAKMGMRHTYVGEMERDLEAHL
jgi:hypothetical protein